MGLIIAVAQQKGGAGKTTLVAQLALAWMAAGRSVCAIDVDPQGTLAAWSRHHAAVAGANALQVQALTGWRVASEAEKRARDHDIVLVDSPPHAATDAKVAVRAANLVVVPVQPSPFDLWATAATLELAKAEKRSVLLVLNRVPARGRLSETMAQRIAELGVPLAAHRLGNRIDLASSLADGVGVATSAPGSVAAREVKALAAEILAAAEAAAQRR